MIITLKRLRLGNFKGITALDITLAPKTAIRGRNESGKTTTFDAVKWLLFGKDSTNRKDFSIKTLDENNQPVHNLNHEVEATFDVDGTEATLRKVFYEKWTKRRGSNSKEFTGHSTDYYIDGVPVKQKKFQEYISSWGDEETIRLLTDPRYFNEMLHWEKRRELLLSVSGDLSDDAVIASEDALKELPEILAGKSVEDRRKQLRAKMKEINKELEDIPVRIDEANLSKPDLAGLNEAELQAHVAEAKQKVEEAETKLSRLQNGGEVAEQQRMLAEVEAEITRLKAEANGDLHKRISELESTISRFNSTIKSLDMDIATDTSLTNRTNQEVEKKERRVQSLREEWAGVNEEEFEYNGEETCPSCGQELPAEKVEEAKEHALAHFNERKSTRLENIQQSAGEEKQEIERLNNVANESAERVAKAEGERAVAQRNLEHKKQELESLQNQGQGLNLNPELTSKEEEKQRIQTKITELRSSVLTEVEETRKEIIQLRDDARHKESALSSFEHVRKLDERIKQLSQQEKKLSTEYQELERQLQLTEAFVVAKVGLMEDLINSKFKYARFKLFKENINGGIEETCTTTFKGVPYPDLNNAAQITVGLDIIQTLSEHYGINAPCIVDNAEAVNGLPDIDSQLIALYVSDDRGLTVEEMKIMEAVR